MKPIIKFYCDGSIIKKSTVSLVFMKDKNEFDAYLAFEAAYKSNQWSCRFANMFSPK